MRGAAERFSIPRTKAYPRVATLDGTPVADRSIMSASITKEVVCATLVSISLFGCAAGEVSSPPEDDGNPMVAPTSTGAGGAGVPSSGTGGTPTPPAGGQVGNGGSVPASGAGGSQPVGNGGGTSGAPSAGGQSGGGAGPGSVSVLPDNMIDDLEDNDGSILQLGSRVGAWYTYHDATAGGTQTPEMGIAFVPQDCGHASVKCARTSGSGFKDYGAGFGFDFNNSGSAKGIYDVGSFTGVAFWAKGTPFRLKVLTSATVPAAEGGSCATTKCSDNFGTAIAASADYQQFVVPFSSLTQEGWGDKVTFDPKTVIGVQFQVKANVTFDISIDDVGLY